MQLLDAPRKLGDRLGIIELASVSTQPSAPVKIQTRTVTLAELVTKIQITEIRELADLPSEVSVSFGEVFNAAGIRETGWTVDRLEEFLKSDRVREMDRMQAQHETLRMLAAENVDPADVVKDAVSRDQALDAFEESVSAKRQQWLVSKKQSLSALETQVRALEALQKDIEQEIAAEEQSWKEWRRQKRQREKDMAHAVSYLIDKRVISIEDE